MESLINKRNIGVTTNVGQQANLIAEAVRTVQERRIQDKVEAAESDVETEDVECGDCQKTFQRPKNPYNPKWHPICKSCDEERVRVRAEREKAQRWSQFTYVCPKAYQKSDPEKLPTEAQQIWPRIKDYQYGSKGLIFAGPTGKGKTRLMWKLLARLYIEDGKDVSRFDWHECLDAVMDHDRMRKWLGVVHCAPCLLLDDFGKNKFSDRVEAEIFDLVEYRTSRELPLFITTNETPETLKARMSADRGEPLLRRLFEFCDVITF